jgi:hypothetical protein
MSTGLYWRYLPRGAVPPRSPGIPVDIPVPDRERLTLKGPALIDFLK